MPQIGPLELAVVAVIALIVFGPNRLPEMARSFGKAMSEFKRQANDIKKDFESGLKEDEEKRTEESPAHETSTASPSVDSTV